MLDQIAHLFRLQAILQEGSMRKAAERLGVTQPALSRSIAQLEARFGKPLLVRTSRGIAPTGFGARVAATVNRLARHWELSEADLLSDGTAITGKIRLTAGPLWRAVVLPAVITRLQAQFTGLEVVLEGSLLRTTLQDLLDGRIDAVFGGVQMADSAGPRVVRRQFTTVYDRVMAREDHPLLDDLVGGQLRDPADVLRYPWIVYTGDPVYELRSMHGAIERFGRAPDVRIRSESLVATIGFLQRGDYLCILPEAAVSNVSAPRIVAVPVVLGHRLIRSGVVFRQEMADWPPMIRLLELCEEYFAAAPAPD